MLRHDKNVRDIGYRSKICNYSGKAGLLAVFAQQRPWKAQSLSRADRSSLASEASDPRSGLGLEGEHGSGSRSVERQQRGATSHDP